MHLYEWHAMLERRHREGMNGDTPSMPAPGYKWSNIKLINKQIWGKYQDVTLNFALKKLKLSHERVMNLIKLHTNEEIMTKKYYKWTSNHYIWAIKKCEFIAKFIEGGIKH